MTLGLSDLQVLCKSLGDGGHMQQQELEGLLDAHGHVVPGTSESVLSLEEFIRACQPNTDKTSEPLPSKLWRESVPLKQRKMDWSERTAKMEILRKQADMAAKQYATWRQSEDQKLMIRRETKASEWEEADHFRATGHRPGELSRRWEDQRLNKLSHRVSHAYQGW
eukprot:TRINITY_DN26666_c0_g1_i2.p1 TRINITY_DN26666_c0_g1~~TRINITY_DN26666_c0_g1_i2.p1  ORF type:complete len:166 (-),score=32.09 TRINITY_DN26666_c0_g1_i2:263-760(-)